MQRFDVLRRQALCPPDPFSILTGLETRLIGCGDEPEGGLGRFAG